MTFDYAQNKGDYLKLWTYFKSSLVEVIAKTDFKEAWEKRPDRTYLYFNSLLEKTATIMGLKFLPEMKFRVDGTFYLEGSQGQTKIPIVLIESENEAKKSDDEVYKLCFLNAPLKVLMISHEWNQETEKELSEGYWDYILEDFSELTIMTGYFVVVIAEWMENLKFYSRVYDQTGKTIETELIFQK